MSPMQELVEKKKKMKQRNCLQKNYRGGVGDELFFGGGESSPVPLQVYYPIRTTLLCTILRRVEVL